MVAYVTSAEEIGTQYLNFHLYKSVAPGCACKVSCIREISAIGGSIPFALVMQASNLLTNEVLAKEHVQWQNGKRPYR